MHARVVEVSGSFTGYKATHVLPRHWQLVKPVAKWPNECYKKYKHVIESILFWSMNTPWKAVTCRYFHEDFWCINWVQANQSKYDKILNKSKESQRTIQNHSKSMKSGNHAAARCYAIVLRLQALKPSAKPSEFVIASCQGEQWEQRHWNQEPYGFTGQNNIKQQPSIIVLTKYSILMYIIVNIVIKDWLFICNE